MLAGVELEGLYLFDPVQSTWTLLSGLSGAVPRERTSCSLVALGDTFFLFGGYTTSGPLRPAARRGLYRKPLSVSQSVRLSDLTALNYKLTA